MRARDDARPERRARHASVVSATRRVGSCSARARWQRHREHDGAEGGKAPTIRLPSTVEVAAIADLGERNLGERFEFVAAVRGEAHSLVEGSSSGVGSEDPERHGAIAGGLRRAEAFAQERGADSGAKMGGGDVDGDDLGGVSAGVGVA